MLKEDYNYLKARAPQLQAAGFDVVWTPPPSQGDGMGYFPKQLFSYGNAHGSETQLRAMLADFASRGIHGMADIVANHRTGTIAWADFTNPTWSCSAIVDNDEVKGVSGQIQPCSGQNDEGEGFSGSRDLNHKSAQVQQGFRDYLNNLKGLGFDSWRYDFTKGFPAKYVGEYNASSSPYFSVGEYWDANIGLLTGWVNASGNTLTGTTKRSSTFDFSLYYILARAINNGNWYELNNGGKMPGLAGTYGYADYAVTFAENHDTHEITGTTNILKANAYILTHPGIPMVFSKHWLDNKQKINELIAVRKQNNINAWSVTNVVASSTFYAAYIDNKVAVKIGPGFWSPTGADWILNTSGTDYAVWSKINITTPSVTPEPFLNISLIGPAVGGWGTDVAMSTTDGVTYKIYSKDFVSGAVKFRANQSWSANWGATTFPTGTGVSYGADIPVVAGSYNVTFNRQTGVYSFSAPTSEPLNGFTQLTVTGPAVGGWGTDINLNTTDGITYTLTDYTFLTGGLKIRQDLAWTKNWGSAAFPSGTGIQNGADIPVPAGVYSLTFNILNGTYAFLGTDHRVGISGTAVNGAWSPDVDMTSKDNGVNYTLEYTFTDGEVKFRKDDGWTVNWGATAFPSGTGVQGGGNIPVSAGTYKITFNANTGAYNFELLPSSISSFTPTTGSTGDVVTILGSNFIGITAVKFGGVAASSFTVVSPTTITAVVGSGASGKVSIEKSSGIATSKSDFVITSSSQITPSQCGTTLSSLNEPIYATAVGGAQMYRFEVTNGAIIRTYDSVNSTFNLSNLSGGGIYATTYSIRVAVKLNDLWSDYGIACNVTTPVTTTKIEVAQCGTTLSTLNQSIFAVSISGAQKYRFEVTNGATVRTFDTTQNKFSLANLSGGGAYGTVYSIRVALQFNNVWADYGVACNVTTPVTTTKIEAVQCGTTLPTLNQSIFAVPISGAQKYRFEVTNGATVRTFDTTQNKFSLVNLSGGGAYGTVYSIRVALQFNNVWANYGVACNVTTPVTTTKIEPVQCGTTLSTLNKSIFAVPISGAQKYRFEVTNGATVRTFDTTQNKFSLVNLSGGGAYGTVYSIRVALQFNNVWANYGTSCNITTPNASGKSSLEEVFETTAVYPNPYSESFKIAFSGNDETSVQIMIYDASGRLVSQKETSVTSIENDEFGQGLSAGVYTVQVQQGEQIQILRVVKQ